MRAVRLTDAGREERARLDEASDALAGSLLAPLGERQRERLVEAMATVERLLTAGLVEVAPEDPAGAPPRRRCLAAYFAEIDERFEHGWDPSVGIRLDPADMAPPRGLILLARLDGEPDRLRRALAPRRRDRRRQADVGRARGRAASASAAGCWPSWSATRARPASARCAWTPTAP